MNPTADEMIYAEKQIEEANRRLEDIYERVGQEGVKYIKDSEEGRSEISMSTTGDIVPEDVIEEALEDEKDEYDKKDVITGVSEELVGSHIQNVIIDCQLCIELAAKSMFKLTGKDHPFSHSISFDDGRTKGFYSEIPDEFALKDDVVRVIFLTQFWGEFYELAKYGAPQLNVRPEMIFEEDDGSRAVEDAEYCIEVAEELLDYVQNEKK